MIFYQQRDIIQVEEGYDIAQICFKGHVVNSCAKSYPQFNQKFCAKCGTETVTRCSTCNTPIRGSYMDGLSANYTPPGFCVYCGAPYPWTQAKLRAARELAQELDTLTAQDKAILSSSIDDLVTDSPFSGVAATRLKKIMAKTGQDTAATFREILVDIASESARKVLWP
jgi:hypothetical protein